jgi:hypothetical protein
MSGQGIPSTNGLWRIPIGVFWFGFMAVSLVAGALMALALYSANLEYEPAVEINVTNASSGSATAQLHEEPVAIASGQEITLSRDIEGSYRLQLVSGDEPPFVIEVISETGGQWGNGFNVQIGGVPDTSN